MFEAVTVGGRRLVAPGSASGIVATGTSGRRYSSAASAPTEVALETDGPIRKTVRVSGKLSGSGGVLLHYVAEGIAVRGKLAGPRRAHRDEQAQPGGGGWPAPVLGHRVPQQRCRSGTSPRGCNASTGAPTRLRLGEVAGGPFEASGALSVYQDSSGTASWNRHRGNHPRPQSYVSFRGYRVLPRRLADLLRKPDRAVARLFRTAGRRNRDGARLLAELPRGASRPGVAAGGLAVCGRIRRRLFVSPTGAEDPRVRLPVSRARGGPFAVGTAGARVSGPAVRRGEAPATTSPPARLEGSEASPAIPGSPAMRSSTTPRWMAREQTCTRLSRTPTSIRGRTTARSRVDYEDGGTGTLQSEVQLRPGNDAPVHPQRRLPVVPPGGSGEQARRRPGRPALPGQAGHSGGREASSGTATTMRTATPTPTATRALPTRTWSSAPRGCSCSTT